MELVDIGVNLSHRHFAKDQKEVIERARSAGVSLMVVTGTSEKVSQKAFSLTQKYPDYLYATAGVHPHDAKHFTSSTQEALRKLSTEPSVVAIGECGLDFDRDFSPRPEQETCFEKQLELATQCSLPVFLHERAAHKRFLEIIKPFRDNLADGVVHCFTGTEEELKSYLALDLFIGITGWICDERRGKNLQSIIRHVPLERLMIETDAPFLTPRDLSPKPKQGRNEPAFLPHILKKIASCLSMSPEKVAEYTTRNARAFFRIPRKLPAEGDTRFA